DVDTAAAPTPDTLANFGLSLTSLAVSSDGTVVYAAGPSNEIQTVTVATKAKGKITSIAAGHQVSALSVVQDAGADLVVAATVTGANIELYVIKLNPETLFGPVPLDYSPVAVAAPAGGHWSYVLERGTAASYIQAVNIHGLLQNLPTSATKK